MILAICQKWMLLVESRSIQFICTQDQWCRVFHICLPNTNYAPSKKLPKKKLKKTAMSGSTTRSPPPPASDSDLDDDLVLLSHSQSSQSQSKGKCKSKKHSTEELKREMTQSTWMGPRRTRCSYDSTMTGKRAKMCGMQGCHRLVVIV